MKIAWFAAPLVAGAIAVAWQQPAVNLPPPYATPSAKNAPKVISRPDGAQLKVPAGFTVEEFASGFAKPRIMVQGPGDLFQLVLLKEFPHQVVSRDVRG